MDFNLGLKRSLYHQKKKIRRAYQSYDMYAGFLVDRLLRKSVRKKIIINGFWRSGTTWLQSKICVSVKGKSVFEPFGPYVGNDVIYSKSDLMKSNLSREFQSAFMPFVSVKEKSSSLNEFIDSSLNANIKSKVIRRLRPSFLSSFRNIVVCKFVRGSLLLPYLIREYSEIPIIHIYRDPRAVIASITRNGWGYWFEDFSLQDHFLNMNDGRSDYFNNFQEFILKYDEQDVQSRICAYWCLTERFIIDNVSDEKNFLRVSYDELITTDFKIVTSFLSNYNFKWYENNYGEKSSATTSQYRKSLSSKEKRDSWKKELDPTLKKKIEDIVSAFNLDFVLT